MFRTLQRLNLPASLDALDRPIGLPPSLLKKAEEVRLEDGLVRIDASLENLEILSGQIRDILDEVPLPSLQIAIIGCTKLQVFRLWIFWIKNHQKMRLSG